MQLGVIERALELTAEYARSRVQFGRPIGAFQAVAQRLADAYIDVEAVRLTHVAGGLAAGGRACRPRPRSRRPSSGPPTPATGSRTPRCTSTAAMGIDTELPAAPLLHRRQAGEFALGGATAQLRRIGAALASAG